MHGRAQKVRRGSKEAVRCGLTTMYARDLSPEAAFAFACFLKAEINRHRKDIENAERDLERLRDIGVDVDLAFDMGFVTTGD